jgi:hypothetical protein
MPSPFATTAFNFDSLSPPGPVCDRHLSIDQHHTLAHHDIFVGEAIHTVLNEHVDVVPIWRDHHPILQIVLGLHRV